MSVQIEHVRDTFRFKGVVYSFRDALHVVYALDKHMTVFKHGITKESVAKVSQPVCYVP